MLKRILSDKSAMQRALALALRGRGFVKPNPLVGALVVSSGQIVGRGWHRKAGCKHAEIEALEQAGELAKGATLYVTLEPCNHHGKTPPCTSAVIKAGISRVVCAMRDPNPEVSGGGLEELKNAGVEVEFGLLEEEARTINRSWLTLIEKNRPFVLLKLASTVDYSIAGREGKRITISSSASLRHSQKLRSYFDSILVGVGTVLKDDPELTNRTSRGVQPLKVILDPSLKTPAKAKIFERGRVLIFCSAKADLSKKQVLENVGAEVVSQDVESMIDLLKVFEELKNRGIQGVLCEGGGRIAKHVLENKLCDRFLHYCAPIEIADGLKIDIVVPLEKMTVLWEKKMGGDRVRLYGS